mmetsp:Transcript_28022/g.80672  ORF Transcript_28022/g.80672 Transcript_28022/m.80672 type:complete len:389 (-) Transcript_28022:1151-2317(-)
MDIDDECLIVDEMPHVTPSRRRQPQVASRRTPPAAPNQMTGCPSVISEESAASRRPRQRQVVTIDLEEDATSGNAAVSSASARGDGFTFGALPDEVMRSVMAHLAPHELLRLFRVEKCLAQLTHTREIWVEKYRQLPRQVPLPQGVRSENQLSASRLRDMIHRYFTRRCYDCGDELGTARRLVGAIKVNLCRGCHQRYDGYRPASQSLITPRAAFEFLNVHRDQMNAAKLPSALGADPTAGLTSFAPVSFYFRTDVEHLSTKVHGLPSREDLRRLNDRIRASADQVNTQRSAARAKPKPQPSTPPPGSKKPALAPMMLSPWRAAGPSPAPAVQSSAVRAKAKVRRPKEGFRVPQSYRGEVAGAGKRNRVPGFFNEMREWEPAERWKRA